MELELHDLLLASFDKDGDGPDTFNCWNLCREIYRRAGRVLPLYSKYIQDISKRDELIQQIKGDDFIKLDGPEFLAIVTLRLSHTKAITHVGVVINKRRFVHITKKGVSVERFDIGVCSKKIEGFYRYAGNN